ncbi:MAG TPA: hypothetical protein VN723_05455 [Rhizomicrobium sp.]|jgi:hypothetical protein|nr:hypothetical protein [Rhizomicrobium sp.]
MSRTRGPAGDPSEEDVRRRETCDYIFDLLGSLEAMALQHDLSVLAKLIQSAKSEAAEYR